MQEWLGDRLQKLPDLHVQRMFGGAGIYSDDTMFGILANGRIYLKTDAVTRVAFSECGMGLGIRPNPKSLRDFLAHRFKRIDVLVARFHRTDGAFGRACAAAPRV
jgi:hypothetical protein